MKLHQLASVQTKGKKRVGRGLGSGKGKTAGRGSKGQKARGKIPASFIGGTLPLYKKLPLKRGKGNTVLGLKPRAVNLITLNTFKAGTIVDMDQLISQKIIKKQDLKRGVKILSGGELKQRLIIKLPVSESARKKIEKAGGKVDYA